MASCLTRCLADLAGAVHTRTQAGAEFQAWLHPGRPLRPGRVHRTACSACRGTCRAGGKLHSCSRFTKCLMRLIPLQLRVTGSNLTGACKLIFKVARHEQHDALFHENDVLELLIDGLGHASPLDEPEACIYAYGCIRFLTASSAQERDDALNHNWSAAGLEQTPPVVPAPATIVAATAITPPLVALPDPRKLNGQQTLVARLARHGAVELMILHLQMLNEAGATRRLTGPPLHTLYQLSAALRALADVAQQQQRLQLQLQLACPHLIRAAEVSMGELEVQANVVRTLR